MDIKSMMMGGIHELGKNPEADFRAKLEEIQSTLADRMRVATNNSDEAPRAKAHQDLQVYASILNRENVLAFLLSLLVQPPTENPAPAADDNPNANDGSAAASGPVSP
jgi:hypothetical protein